MSSGLNNIIKPIEVSKEDWVNYKGTYIRFEDMTAGQKSWVTKWKKKEKSKPKSDLEKYQTDEKKRQRIIVAELLDKVCKEWEKEGNFYSKVPFTIILESPELLFIKKLFPEWYGLNQEIDYKIPNYIIIPNDSNFEKFPTTDRRYIFHCHNLKLRNDINYNVGIRPKSYLEFIEEYIKFNPKDRGEECCLIWGDYCGAFSTHKKDIEKTFESKILGDNSYYILTFCTRDPSKKKSSSSKINCVAEVTDFVSQCAKKNEYTIELMAKETGLYKSKMYTCFFHIYTDHVAVHRKKLNLLVENLQNYENIRADIEEEFKIIENLIKRKEKP